MDPCHSLIFLHLTQLERCRDSATGGVSEVVASAVAKESKLEAKKGELGEKLVSTLASLVYDVWLAMMMRSFFLCASSFSACGDSSFIALSLFCSCFRVGLLVIRRAVAGNVCWCLDPELMANSRAVLDTEDLVRKNRDEEARKEGMHELGDSFHRPRFDLICHFVVEVFGNVLAVDSCDECLPPKTEHALHLSFSTQSRRRLRLPLKNL